MAFDLTVHVPGGATHEALDDVGLGQWPAEVREDLGFRPDGQALAVDEHTVTVEDHEVEAGHGLQPPALRTPLR